MKKFTKRFLTVSAIVTSLAGVLFGSASIYNSHIEKQNQNEIAEVKREKEQIEKQKQDKMDQISYEPLQTYEREKIYNNKQVDFSQFTVPTTLFTENENYVIPMTGVDTYTNVYKNFQTNKHLYVYLDENITDEEKQLLRSVVDYINTIVHTIDSQYSVTITNQLGDSHAYIHFINDPNLNSFLATGSILGGTEIYYDDSPLYNKPIMIRMNNKNIAKYGQASYDRVYKSTAIHEFLHAAGLDHAYHNKEDDLSRPIMSSTNNGTIDYLSIPELAELFGWLNEEKYAEAERNGTLQEVCNSDFEKYTKLIKYGIEQSLNNNNFSQRIEDNQIIQIKYDETPDDGKDYKTTLTFNYPFANFCEKTTPQEDGSVEKSVKPFISAPGKMIILNEDCKHIDEKDFRNSQKEGTYEYKTGLTYDEVMEEIKTMDPRNGYEISNNIFDVKVNHYEYETQNFWQKLNHTSTKNDIKVVESLYNISYLYTWQVGNFKAEETTNNFDKNLLSNYNVSYVGDDYAKN